MAKKTKLDAVLDAIGAAIPDTPEAWALVAMHCLDQAGVSCSVQDEISAVLRSRAGIVADAETKVL